MAPMQIPVLVIYAFDPSVAVCGWQEEGSNVQELSVGQENDPAEIRIFDSAFFPGNPEA
jgi:hypothetical protein